MNKAVPMRTCVICRKKMQKKNLHRYVVHVTEEGSFVLAQGEGRGYYHCTNEKCIQLFVLLRWFTKRKRVKHESSNY